MEDTGDSKSPGLYARVGSNPTSGTIKEGYFSIMLIVFFYYFQK